MGLSTCKLHLLDMADSLNRFAVDDEAGAELGDLVSDERAAADLENVNQLQAGQTMAVALWHGLTALPTMLLEVIHCWFYKQIIRPQIARVLGITANEMKRVESRVLRSLRLDREVQNIEWTAF